MAKNGAEVVELGQNISGSISGNVLTLTIDLSKRLGPSKSGKTMLIATTGSAKPVGASGAVAGINIYTKE